MKIIESTPRRSYHDQMVDRHFLIVLACSLSLSTINMAQPKPPKPPPVEAPATPETIAYLAAVEKAEAGKGTAEEAFVAARAVRDALLRNDDAGNNFIESLTEAQFQALTKDLRGLIVNREEVLVVEPDPHFLESLAAKGGRRVDHDFLRIYSATFPNGIWPSYVEQQTDVTGCTDFGGGELVKRYAGWNDFRRRHPHAYVDEVATRIADIEEALDSTCACRKKEDVLRELQQFAGHFPNSPVTKRVKQRIREIRAGTSNMRYDCISG